MTNFDDEERKQLELAAWRMTLAVLTHDDALARMVGCASWLRTVCPEPRHEHERNCYCGGVAGGG